MAIRKSATKKSTGKGAAKKRVAATKKTGARKVERKTAVKNATRKTAVKTAVKKSTLKTTATKRTRNPLATATAVHRAAAKKLASVKKAYDQAVIAEGRAADKLKAVSDRIANKAAKKGGESGD
jgi:hypothetical protein